MEDDIDIYGDLPEFGKDDDDALGSLMGKRIEEEHGQLKTKLANLTEELENFKKAKVNLEVNLSSLLKTAKAELARKDRTISELRSKLDNFAFRRGFHPRQRLPYQHIVPVEHSFAPALQPVENVATYDYEFQPAQEITTVYQDYSYNKREEEEEEDARPNKEQLMRAATTVFGERLRKRLMEEEQLEKEQKSNSQVEKVTESDKENNLVNDIKNHEIVDQPVVHESNETNKCLSVKTDDQDLSNRLATSRQRKRMNENEIEEKHVKRKRAEKYETDMEAVSYPEFLDHSNQNLQSYNHMSKKRHKSTFEHDRTYNEYRKYNYFDKDATHEQPYKRSLDKHMRVKAYSPDIQRSTQGRTNSVGRFNERSHYKERNDYNTDPDYNHRHWNKYKEDHHTNNKYDRPMLQALHDNEHEQSSHRVKPTRLKKRENWNDFKSDAKVERFPHRESRIPLKTRKLGERQLSTRKNDDAEEEIRKDVKHNRRNSMSSMKSEKRERRRRRRMADIVKSESMDGSNPKSTNRHFNSFEKVEDIPKSYSKEDKINCIDIVENVEVDNNHACPNEGTDNDSCLEEGEIPSSPNLSMDESEYVKNEEFIENIQNEQLPAIPEEDIDENKEEEHIFKIEEQKQIENECIIEPTTSVSEQAPAAAETEDTGIIEESAHFDDVKKIEEEAVKAPDEVFDVPKDNVLNNKELPPDNANATEETDVPTKVDTEPDNDDDIIGIFGDGKDANSLTAAIQQERENCARTLETPKILDEQNIILTSEEPLVSSTGLNYNDSIEKKLEIMESSSIEPNVSKILETFRDSVDVQMESIAEQPAETIEVSGYEECSTTEQKVESVENEVNNPDQTKSSTSSTSSSSSPTSSSSTSSSSSSSSSTSLSTSSEIDDGLAKEEKKEETITETVPEKIEIPTTDIAPSSPCNTEVPCKAEAIKLDIEEPISVPKPSSVEEEVTKEPPVIENQAVAPPSPIKVTRKREIESNAPLKLNGRVVVVVRRRRPVRLSNNSNVTVVVSPKSSNPCLAKTNGLSEDVVDTKLRACRTPRLKNS